MDKIVSAVMDAVHRAGLVEVEVSARHVHLSQADVEVLFGPGAVLAPKRPLSQPGQFATNEKVEVIAAACSIIWIMGISVKMIFESRKA